MEIHTLPRDAVAVMVPVVSAGLVAAGQVGVWVGSDMVADTQTTYARKVSIRRDGGPQVDQVQSVARLGVNCWAPAEAQAVALAGFVQRAILQSPDGVVVLGAECMSGPSLVPDVAQAAHAYSTFEVVISGA